MSVGADTEPRDSRTPHPGTPTPNPQPPADQDATARPTPTPRAAAIVGILTGLAGIAAGQVTAAFLAPDAAPLAAIGNLVVDATPAAVKEWAVNLLGFADKAVLLTVIAIVALALCAGIGLLARRRLTWGLVAIAILGSLPSLAAVTRPAATAVWAIPGLVTIAVGGLVLWWLLPRAARAYPAQPGPEPSEDPGPLLDLSEPAIRPTSQPDRRDFLVASTAVAGVSTVALLGSGAWLQRSGPVAPAATTLPTPTNPLPPLPDGLETRFPRITPWVTPNDDYYRIDTAFIAPRVSRDDWSLTIDGDVANPYTLTWDDLADFELIERDITLTCVSYRIGGDLAGGARWLGVRTRDLLERAGVGSGVEQIFSSDVNGMTISTPVQALTDEREALLAIGMNGQPLPRDHGFPARLVTPGLYGFVGSTKWVTRLHATTYAAQAAYWTMRGWATYAPIFAQARIDTPNLNLSVAAGEETHIGGIAWAQQRGIDAVEVRIDDGEWQRATLGPDAGTDYWVQWYLPWTPTPGKHFITARVVDGDGEVQTEQRRNPYPEGASGWHTVQTSAN